jgi:YHS domain-containing protein
MAEIVLSKTGHKINLAGVFILCMFMPMMPHGCSTMAAHQKHQEKSQDAGNQICPVSGEKIDAKTKVTYNYQGKVYNFCRASCVEEFKKAPEKYIKKIEEEKLQRITKQEELLSEKSRQHSH